MSKYQFVDKGANLQSKGFIKDQVYEVKDRRPVPNEQGTFMFTVEGPGLVKPLVLREGTINREFALLSETVQQAPVQQVVPQAPQPSVQQQPQPVSNPVLAQQPLPQPQGVPIPQQPKVSAEQIVKTVENGIIHLESILKRIESKPQPQVVQTEQKGSVKDLLLSELLKLDFTACNIKIIKTEKDTSVSVIVDGLPPLSLTAKDVSEEEIVKMITQTFTESAMVVTSCREWIKRIQELNAEKEAEAKKAKESLEKAKKEAVKPADTKTETSKADSKAGGKKTTIPVEKKAEMEQKAADQASFVYEAPAEEDDLPIEEPSNDLTEFSAEEANQSGLSPDVEIFEL